MKRWLAPLVACGLLGTPVTAGAQAVGSPTASSAASADAPSVHLVVPERPYLRRRAAQLSDELRTPDDVDKPWLAWEHASGDWGGLRPLLHERGIIPQIEFTGELFSNLRGGLTTSDATHAAGLTSLSLSLDSTRLGLWRGGTAVLSVQRQDGRGVSREVGSFSEIGTLDGAPKHFTQADAYYLQQAFLDGGLIGRVGKSDSNLGFVDSELASLFLNGDFAPPSQIPMPTYPDPALGLALFADPAHWLTLAAGAWGGDLGVHEYGGAGLFRGRVFAIAELTLHASPLGLPGHYNAGAWLRSVETADPAKPPGGRSFPRNYGVYMLFDQQLSVEDPQRPQQGLGAWFQASWAPQDRNPNDWWVGGGLVYTGPIPGRDRDQLGIAVAHIGLGADPGTSGNPPAEIVVECFYAIELAPWLELQPDFQLVLDPAAGGRDAWVLGAQLSIAL